MKKNLTNEEMTILAKYTELRLKEGELSLLFERDKHRFSKKAIQFHYDNHSIILKAMDRMVDVMASWE